MTDEFTSEVNKCAIDERMNATNVCERCEVSVHQTRRNGEITGMHESRRVDTHTSSLRHVDIIAWATGWTLESCHDTH
jgi:hypothetical protein